MPKGGQSDMSEREVPIRVLVAKPGLDGHDRGAKVLVRILRDAGMEAIYTGLHQTPEQIAQAALQEDVDVVGLSILSGAHTPLTEKVVRQLHARGLDDVIVVVGGTVPDEEVEEVKAKGAAAVFPTGTPFEAVIDFIRQSAQRR